MFKNIKGYMKRLRGIKKDKKFISPGTSYGEFGISYIDGVVINDDDSNIILEIYYSYNETNIIQDATTLLNLLSSLGFHFISKPIDEENHIFISGNIEKYALLVNYYFINPDYTYNKLLRGMYNLLNKIDATAPYMILEDINDVSDDHIYSYKVERIHTTNNNPIYVQNIDIELISDLIKSYGNDILEDIISLMIVYIDDENLEQQSFYILDFLYNYYTNEYMTDIYNKYKDSYYSNFNISEFKNIFDINFKVTIDDDSMYDDIDEIID